ncbi:inorganic phosphate transporter [Sediminitomix flava]|uniref:Phosphate transporter n=1 Tax=Sediminitomix flava TaxID=379075 RepID=A0A315ZEW7_SEDFL|nr:inorganic phosphate transporter [Sediminitomix flava]PWJ43274.1 phosphate transporter family protein [Sediminitomix flava]
MENYYLVIVVLMLLLAIFDLIVGVSNDAVNFLTSAVGSKAASFKRIIIVASCGIFLGAISSGGMMEIAKKGIFNPSLFSFQNIIFIYVVVMVSDIFLLDLFNSLKLPTSTTISIVFELLGASLATSFLIVYDQGLPVNEWLEFINTKKAGEMIVAIFVSVLVAFSVGWLVQYILRLAVTFEYKKHMRIGGSIFGGLSVFIVINFIVNVAFKHSPLKNSEILVFLSSNTLGLFLITFTLAFLFFFLKSKKEGFDTFQVITMLGTFALAMAFASNDLVNFIGVPLAGLEAFVIWKDTGVSASAYKMEVFNDATQQLPFVIVLLVAAGIIMSLVLWTSKKAKNVIQTTVNLSRQADGVERFNGNIASRGAIKFVTAITKVITSLVPEAIKIAIERRYKREQRINVGAKELPPAFDLVRASVNLIVAAWLITLGTSLKLPLSTTYVSFMVVMGTSLADRAWNQDSAVYRVSGVFTVILGWFITALTALGISALLAVIVYYYEFVGVVIITILSAFGIFMVNRLTNNEVEAEIAIQLPTNWYVMSQKELGQALEEQLKDLSNYVFDFEQKLTNAIIKYDHKTIKELDDVVSKHNEQNLYYQAALIRQLRNVEVKDLEAGKILLTFYVEENEILRELSEAIKLAKQHVLNMHTPLDDLQIGTFHEYISLFEVFNNEIQPSNGNTLSVLQQQNKAIDAYVEKGINLQLQGLSEQKYTYKNSRLFLGSIIRHLHVSEYIIGLYTLIFPQEGGE